MQFSQFNLTFYNLIYFCGLDNLFGSDINFIHNHHWYYLRYNIVNAVQYSMQSELYADDKVTTNKKSTAAGTA